LSGASELCRVYWAQQWAAHFPIPTSQVSLLHMRSSRLASATRRRESRALAAERTLPLTVLQVLREQQASLPPSAARQANLNKLAAGQTAVVATGQQVGLFLGPLYAFYKAASAIAVARAIEAESGVRCVPLFWLQTEDHDFEEIRSCTVAGRDGEPVHLVLPDEGGARVSVAYRTLPEQVSELLDKLAESLDPGPAAEETLALLRDHYQPGQSMAAAFASVIAAVFADEGLLVFNPRDARVAELAAPIYRVCLDDCEAIEARLQERHVALAAAGFNEQVAVRERGALVFYHRDSEPAPVFASSARSASNGELLGRWPASAEVVRHEEILRTLARAIPAFFHLGPAAAHRSGCPAADRGLRGRAGRDQLLRPAFEPLYAHFGLTPPLLVPRARFRCVDARTRRTARPAWAQGRGSVAPPDELRARLPPPPRWLAEPRKELRALVESQIVPAVERIASAVEAAGAHLQRPAAHAQASPRAGAPDRPLCAHAGRARRDDLARIHRLELALFPESDAARTLLRLAIPGWSRGCRGHSSAWCWTSCNHRPLRHRHSGFGTMMGSRSSLRIGIACFSSFGGSGVVATEIGMALGHADIASASSATSRPCAGSLLPQRHLPPGRAARLSLAGRAILRPGAHGEDDRGRARGKTRPIPSSLRHSACGERVPAARCSGLLRPRS
jgi:hypothetical protein